MVSYNQTFSSISNATEIFKLFKPIQKRFIFDNKNNLKLDWDGDLNIYYMPMDDVNLFFNIYKSMDAIMCKYEFKTTKEEMLKNNEIINFFDLDREEVNSILFEIKDIIENECKF